MKNITIIFLALFLMATGCSEQESVKHAILPSTEVGDDDPVPVLVDGIEEGVPLFLKIGIKWETDKSDEFTNLKTCNFLPTAAVGGTITCNLAVPEGRLFYSHLKFSMGSLKPEACTILNFQPYYYRRSTVDTYVVPGGEPTDEKKCATEFYKTAECWGGAAVKIVPEFPKNGSVYILPAITKAHSWVLDSENKTRWYGGNKVNYTTTNNRVGTAANPPNQLNARAAVSPTTWVDYKIQCLDNWYEPLYTINLTISDVNVEPGDPGGVDNMPDWN